MKSKIYFLTFVFILSFLQLKAQYNSADIATLLAIKESCDSNDTLNWTVDSDESSWTGVTWSTVAPYRVRSLKLSALSLTGSMDVRNLTQLQTLNCYNNQLTQLMVSGLDSITSLQCSSNKLTGLDLTGLTSLTSLNCVNNLITDLNLTSVSNITYFFCSGNKLTSLDLTGNLAYNYQFRCDSNELYNLVLPDKYSSIIMCSKNHLPFSVLTEIPVVEGLLMPQREVFETAFYTADTTLDYSSEAVIDEVTTTFSFYKDDSLVAENTTGIYSTQGKGFYYCKMVNTSFYGDNNFVTTAPIYIGEVFHQNDIEILKTIDARCDVENNLNWNTSDNPLGWEGITWVQPADSKKRVGAIYIKSRELEDSLDVTGLSELEELDCSDNNISGLNVSGLLKLEVLKCSNNPIPLSSLATGLDVDTFEYNVEDTIGEPKVVYGFQELDYSSEALINGVSTQFVFYKDGKEVETNTTGKYTPTETGVYYCIMTNTELSGVVQTTATVTVYEASQTNNVSGLNDLFYPNPAKSWIYFKNSEKILEVTLYSINGNVLLQSDFAEDGIDITSMEKGMYLIKMKQDNTVFTQRLIIQ